MALKKNSSSTGEKTTFEKPRTEGTGKANHPFSQELSRSIVDMAFLDELHHRELVVDQSSIRPLGDELIPSP
jgi:hypothetical protein